MIQPRQFQGQYSKSGYQGFSIPGDGGLDRRNSQITQSEQEWDASMRQNEKTMVENADLPFKEKEADFKDLSKLAKFSQSAMKVVQKEVDKQNLAQLQEAESAEYETWMQNPDAYMNPEYQEQVGRMEQTDTIAQEAGGRAYETTGNYGAATQVKNLSGWSGLGQQMARARIAGTQFEPGLQQYLQSKGDISYAEAAGHAEDYRVKYMARYGLSGANPQLLGRDFYPNVYDSTRKTLETYRTNEAAVLGQQQRAAGGLTFLANNNMTQFVATLANTPDPRNPNQLIGRAAALDMAMGKYKEFVDLGQMSKGEALRRLEALRDQPIPGMNGKTYGSLHDTRIRKAEQEVAAANRQNWSDISAERTVKWNEAEDDFYRQAMEDPTAVDIEAFQQKLKLINGQTSQRLEALMDETPSGRAEKDMEAKLVSLAENNLLTPEIVQKLPWKLQKEWMKTAQEQEKARQDPAYKEREKAVRGIVADNTNVKTNADGSIKGYEAISVSNELVSEWRRRTAELARDPNISYEQASVQAAEEMKTKFREDQEDPNGRYFVDAAEGFKNWSPMGGLTTPAGQTPQQLADQARLRLGQANDSLRLGGAATLDKPGQYFSRAELESDARNFGKPGYRFPALAEHLAEQLNTSPLAIINRQRDALELPMLEIPPAMEYVQTTLSPEAQTLLNRHNSPDRSTRGLGSAQAYNPTIVPNGYGDMVQQAAQKHGIPPSILAGLIEQESQWDSGAMSDAGARGLGQFMPETAAEFNVDVNDAASSIDGAAKYLKYLQDYFKGDMRMALYAYNGGMGNIERYGGPIPGNRENLEYYDKVMKGAYKYGYGNSVLADPATMRPGSRPRTQYTTGVPMTPQGPVATKTVQSTNASFGMDTSMGPDRGNNACLWAVNKVLAESGVKPPWGDSNYVPHAKDVLDQQGTRLEGPEPGAIAIMQDYGNPPYPHIGIVDENGMIVSNSSSRARFDWRGTPEEYKRKYGRETIYYRL